MANVPTEKEVEKLIAESDSQDRQKETSQEKQGKEFVNNGQGVIPEVIWKNLPGKTL
jgi:hypothetical protein